MSPERFEEIEDLWSHHTMDWSLYTTHEWRQMVCELVAEIHRLQRCALLAACEAALPELEEWERYNADRISSYSVMEPGMQKLRNTITACKVAIANWKGEKGYWTEIE